MMETKKFHVKRRHEPLCLNLNIEPATINVSSFFVKDRMDQLSFSAAK